MFASCSARSVQWTGQRSWVIASSLQLFVSIHGVAASSLQVTGSCVGPWEFRQSSLAYKLTSPSVQRSVIATVFPIVIFSFTARACCRVGSPFRPGILIWVLTVRRLVTRAYWLQSLLWTFKNVLCENIAVMFGLLWILSGTLCACLGHLFFTVYTELVYALSSLLCLVYWVCDPVLLPDHSYNSNPVFIILHIYLFIILHIYTFINFHI